MSQGLESYGVRYLLCLEYETLGFFLRVFAVHFFGQTLLKPVLAKLLVGCMFHVYIGALFQAQMEACTTIEVELEACYARLP